MHLNHIYISRRSFFYRTLSFGNCRIDSLVIHTLHPPERGVHKMKNILSLLCNPRQLGQIHIKQIP